MVPFVCASVRVRVCVFIFIFVAGLPCPAFDRLQIHPKGQVPALAIGEAEGVFESNSIARYMARGTALYGQDDLEASRIDAFLDVALQLEGQLSTLWYKKMETPWSAEYTPEFLNRQRFAGLSTLQAFEKQLSFGDYLVGDDITLADIVLFCVLVRAFEWNIFDDEELQEFPHIVDHFGRIGVRYSPLANPYLSLPMPMTMHLLWCCHVTAHGCEFPFASPRPTKTWLPWSPPRTKPEPTGISELNHPREFSRGQLSHLLTSERGL